MTAKMDANTASAAETQPRIGHKLELKSRTGDIRLDEDLSFVDLGLGSVLIKGLSRSGFEKPSPIQLAAIPHGRCGLGLCPSLFAQHCICV